MKRKIAREKKRKDRKKKEEDIEKERQRGWQFPVITANPYFIA